MTSVRVRVFPDPVTYRYQTTEP